MAIYLVWGFLGSGKTTLINYLLSSLVFRNKNVVILENESGKESVDGEMLRTFNFTVVDIKGGCMCCVLRMKLMDTLEEVRKQYHPDIVLIESSGLASLEELRGIPGLSISGVLSVLDVTQYNFLMKLNSTFFKRQFYFSSVIFLTKTEKSDILKVESIIKDLLDCQPLLHVVPDYKTMSENGWLDIWKIINQHRQVFLPVMYNIPLPNFVTETFYLDSPLDESFFRYDFALLNELFGKQIIRAKGILKMVDLIWYKFDFVNGFITLEPMENYSGERNFLSVWWNQNTDELSREWLKYFLEGREVLCEAASLNMTDEILYQYLSFDPSQVNIEISGMIAKLMKEALEVCVPQLGIRFVAGKKIDREHLLLGGIKFTPSNIITKLLEMADFYVLMVSTVGNELDLWIKQKRMEGDVMEAFIADAIGSALADRIVEYGQLKVECFLSYWKLKVSNSYSPGYCDWDVSEQKLFFSLLPKDFCKVILTESCLMLPLKSVSSLLGAGINIKKKAYGCAICKNKNCYKRKI